MHAFIKDIEKITLDNHFFRQVVYTGQHLQVVLMSLKPGEEIGREVHAIVDQFLRIEAGEGKVIINNEERSVRTGDAIVVPAGAQHNLINTSSEHALKLYTIYAPPHHKDGIVHATKQDAESDTEDHL